MAVSVPPPIYHLKFRDDLQAAKPPPQATAAMAAALAPPPAKAKNKRKSMEPKKLASPSEKAFPPKRLKLGSLDGSDGETTHSPDSCDGRSSSGSSSSGGRQSVSPQQCHALAPKLRFKQEAMKYLEDARPTSANPFRPWDADAPAAVKPNPFLCEPLRSFYPGLLPNLLPLAAAAGPSALLPKPKPELGALPALKTEPPSPPLRVEPDDRSFDDETRQVLSRLYPFLLNRSPATSAEPEQEEPLALVKRSRSDDDDDVFVKEEPPEPGKEDGACKAKQRNYKNMTRERRIEANARERQRVHTITAAFDRLQGAIPTTDDGSGSKLSKLSVIKIATSYIMVLSRMAGYDYSHDASAPTVEECIRKCADLVKAESKTRKKSSESD